MRGCQSLWLKRTNHKSTKYMESKLIFCKLTNFLHKYIKTISISECNHYKINTFSKPFNFSAFLSFASIIVTFHNFFVKRDVILVQACSPKYEHTFAQVKS